MQNEGTLLPQNFCLPTVTENNFSIRENSNTISFDSRAYLYTSSLKLSSWSKFALEVAISRRYGRVVIEIELGIDKMFGSLKLESSSDPSPFWSHETRL